MGRSWVKARRRDRYYRAAKKADLRSRAAFKLLQIQRRFSIVRKGDTVVDLGAAPGGWTQVALDLVGLEGRVLAVDVVPMAPLEHVTVLRGDFTDPAFAALLLTRLGTPADVVLSDAAPKISGVTPVDQARSADLTRAALNIATKALRRGGVFVAKAFRGTDYPLLVKEVSDGFDRTSEYRPKASPKGSAEVYLVGVGKR